MATRKRQNSSNGTTKTISFTEGWERWIPWLPAILGFGLYLNTLTHDYALDDAIVITENMFTQDGVNGIPGLLKYDTFYGFFKEEGKAQLVSGGRYRPLTPIMFAIEQSIFGQSPFMSHLINALLYGLLCCLLFFSLQSLLLPGMGISTANMVALIASLLFASHPLHSEVVANIKGRDEIITLLGCLAAWWAVLKSVDEKRTWWMIAAGVALFLGLMSKEHAISFLLVIPASLWFFRPAYPVKGYFKLWPLLIAVISFLVLRGAVIGWQMGSVPMEMLNNPFIKVVGNQYLPFDPDERWATILYTLLIYIKLLIWPWPLTHDYYPRHIGIYDFSHPLVWLSLTVHIGLVVLLVKGWKKRNPFAFAVLFYMATLSLMSNILFPVGTSMSERFLFMPSVAFILTLALAAVHYLRSSQARKIGFYSLLGITAMWSMLTLQRNPVWKDNYTLFTTDVKVSKNSAKLQNAAGGELIAQAILPENEIRRNALLQQAVGHLERALVIHPAYKNACLLLGNAHNYLQNYEESIRFYQRALALDPYYAEATNNLHITYRDAGRYYGESKGDMIKSLQYLDTAIQLKPDDFETLRLLGIANGIGGHHAEAARYFTKALEKSPENADLMVYLGNAYMHMGLSEEGRKWHERANKVDPGVLERLGIPPNQTSK